MKVLILGGGSTRHQAWIRELGSFMTQKGHDIILHDYKHWSTGDEMANVDFEINAVQEQMKNETDYVIVAKSIGTVIATLGIAQGVFRPKRCIFLGVPYSGVVKTIPAFTQSLKSLPQTIIMQNSLDPTASATDIREKLASVDSSHIILVETPGDTHNYVDFEAIESLLVI